MLAVNSGDLDTVQAMIDAAHPVDFRAEVWEKTPLHVAFINADEPMAKLLVRAGAPLDSTKEKYGLTPLQCLEAHCERPGFPIERFVVMSSLQQQLKIEQLERKRAAATARLAYRRSDNAVVAPQAANM